MQFVMAKARVASLKQVSIPRLELVAAVLSVKIVAKVLTELEFDCQPSVHYWTDSQVVLAYIANDAKQFHTFIANRVQYIRDHTEVDQWRFVKGSINPADLASRGLGAVELAKSARTT